jgi:sugar O-acyltransferase (sialic acid O-acetyltransferase NeuD family)
MSALSRARCVVLGGGGHARMVIDALRAAGEVELVGILDHDRTRWGTEVMGVAILGGDDLIEALARGKADHFTVGLGATGDNEPRRRLFDLARAAGLLPLGVRHPSAVVSSSAVIGAGTQLLPRSVVNASARVGVNAIVNTGAIVEHDCVVGDHVHLASGAVLASTVNVGEGAHVGAGAVVRQGIHIGVRAIVGAGAAVVRDVRPGDVVMGVPARPRPAGPGGTR